MHRLVPLVLSVVGLAAAAAVLAATAGASPPGDGRAAALDEGGIDVAAACLEGAEDCNDMIGIPIDGDDAVCLDDALPCGVVIDPVPGDIAVCADDLDPCEVTVDPPVAICIEGGPKCDDGTVSILPVDSGVYDVSIEFTHAVTQADLDLVTEIVRSYDPAADVLVLERFPPAASARVHTGRPGACERLVDELARIASVASTACEPAAEDLPLPAPDEPVSSEPGAAPGGEDGCGAVHDVEGCGQPPVRSDEGIDPDECNLVHNIDACE